MALSSDFGRRLKELRTLKNMTQARLAEDCGLSVQYLGRVERGLASPSFPVIERFCESLETEPANLFLFAPPAVESRLHKQQLPPESHPDFTNTFVTWTGIWRRDLHLKSDVWSESLLRLFGYASALRKPSLPFFLEHVHHEDRQRVAAAVEQALEGRRLSDFEFAVVRKDGPQRIVIAHCDHLPGPELEVQYVCLVFMDITEWRRLQSSMLRNREQLEEHVSARTRQLHETISTLEQTLAGQADAERQLQIATKVSEASNDALALVTKDCVYAFVNNRYAQFTGRKAEEIVGAAIPDIMGQEIFLQHIKPRLDQALQGRQVQFQIWLDSPVLGSRFMDISYTPFQEEGEVAGIVVTAHDMTKVRQAQEELQEREERFRLMVENMPVLIHAHDQEGNYVFWNRECEKVSGYTAKEITGNPHATRLLYPDLDYREKIFAPSHELDHAFEHRTLAMTAKDGTRRVIAWSNLSPVCPVPGWPYWEVGVEVTRQRQAEEELQASIELFAKAFDSAHVAVAVSRAEDGCYIDANPGFEKLTGYSRDELVGQTSHTLGFFTATERQELAQAVATQGGLSDQELVFRTRRGELRTILFSINPVSLKGEACFVATMVDITGRKLAEEALRHSEAYLRAVFESTDDMICARDTRGRLARCNQAFADFMLQAHGQTAAPGMNPGEYLPKGLASRWEDMLQQALAGHSMRETMRLELQGTVRWLDVSMAPIVHEGQTLGVAEYSRDITAIKEVEAAYARKNELFLQAEQLADVGAWEGDLDKNIWLLSENWMRIHGVAKNPLSSKEIWQLAHPDDVETIAAAFARCLDQGEPYQIRHRILRADTGEVRHIQAYGKVERCPDSGRPLRMVGAAQDITTRVEEEKQLQVARYALDSSLSGVVLADLDEGLSYANKAFRDIFKLPMDVDLRGRRPVDFLVHQSDEHRLLESLRSKGRFFGDLLARRHNGEHFTLQMSAHLVRSPNGEPLCHMASFIDVTEQRKILDRLLQSEERFESLAENINGILFRGTLDFAPFFMRGAVEKITGYQKQDFLEEGLSWDRLVHPDDLPALLEPETSKKLATIPGHSLSREYRILRKDGQLRWVHENLHNVPDLSGKPQFVEGVLLDVSEKRLAQAQLLASYQRFQKVVDMLPQLVSFVDKDLRYRFVNREYERFFNLRSEDILGRHVVEVIGHTAFEAARQHVERALAGETVHYLAELLYPDKRRHTMDAWLLPDTDESGAVLGYYAVLHDVTPTAAA